MAHIYCPRHPTPIILARGLLAPKQQHQHGRGDEAPPRNSWSSGQDLRPLKRRTVQFSVDIFFAGSLDRNLTGFRRTSV